MPSGIIDGQPVDQANSNPAWIAANGDDEALGKIKLNDQDLSLVSGPAIDNIQREHNSSASFLGKAINAIKNLLPSWTSDQGFVANQDVYTRVDGISNKFKTVGGHSHNPLVAGDGSEIQAASIGAVRLAALIQQGVNIIGATGTSSNISAQFALKNPSNAQTVKGVVVNAPQNMVVLRQAVGANQGDSFLDGAGNIVYGRVTEAAGVWTLSFYSLVGAVETAFNFAAPTDIGFYYQEIFNPLTDGPVYNAALFIPSDNTTADVVDASPTQRGVVSTGAQSFAGDKTMQGSLELQSKLLASNQANNQSGTNVTLTVPLAPIVLLTNAGLVSVSNIAPPLAGQLFVLINKTGGDVVLNNLNVAAGDIITGTGSNYTLKNNSSVLMTYDFTNSRWSLSGATPAILATVFGSTPNANGYSYNVATGAFELQPASASFAGGVNTLGQEFAGEKRFITGVAFQVGTDSTTTGSDQTIDGGTVGVLKLTNVGLVSVNLIQRFNDTAKLLVLMNSTGVAIILKNLVGTETGTAKQIRTGTSVDLSVADGAAVILVYDEVSDKWQVVGGSGSGSTSSGINYLSTFTPAITKNTVAATTPDLTFVSGGTNITFALSGVLPLRGADSWVLTKDAANRQGEQVILPWTLERADVAKVLRNICDYAVASGTYADGDVGVYVAFYNGASWALVNNTPINILNSALPSEIYQTEFQTNGTTTNTLYRLILHIQSTSALAYSLKFDNFQLGPNPRILTGLIVDEKLYVPATTQGFGVPTGFELFQSMVGEKLKVRGRFTLGVTTAVTARLDLPTGFVIKSGINNSNVGTFARGGAHTNKGGFVLAGGGSGFVNFTTSDVIGSTVADSTSNADGTAVGNSGEIIFIEFEVPIQGAGSSQIVDDGFASRSIGFAASINTAPAIGFGAFANVPFNVIEDDTVAGWNGTQYVVKSAGRYAMKAALQPALASWTLGRYIIIAIYRNNVQLRTKAIYIQFTGVQDPNAIEIADLDIPCVAGDLLEIRTITNEAAGRLITVAPAENYVSIIKNQTQNQVVAADKTNAVYKTAAGQSIPDSSLTIVDFETPEIASNSGLVTVGAAWKFTANEAADFDVSAFLAFSNGGGWAAADNAEVHLFKNGSSFALLSFVGGQATHTNFVGLPCSTRQVSLLVGEYIDIRVQQQSGAALSLIASLAYNWVSIKKVK